MSFWGLADHGEQKMGTKLPNENEKNQSYGDIVEEHGPWTAMAIRMAPGQHTIEGAQPDRRLKRLLQTVTDSAKKPISELRVLDLACLEGHYAIEFASHGAEVVGIEIRDAHLAKARFIKNQLNLDKLNHDIFKKYI